VTGQLSRVAARKSQIPNPKSQIPSKILNPQKELNTSLTSTVLSVERGSRTMEVPLQIAFREPALAEMEGAASRDERFVALVNRQARFIFRVAYSVLRNAHDAEDVVQETFLKLYRRRKWEGMVDERAFLARTAWRMAVDRLPKARRDAVGSGFAASSTNPEQLAITADWHATVWRLVDALPEELRQPLALSALEELNSGEISQVMGIPDGTVRTRLMRAREILKQKLGALREGRHAK
jgi:RNA polymerase sigma-70 factor (ECF subfamily)